MTVSLNREKRKGKKKRWRKRIIRLEREIKEVNGWKMRGREIGRKRKDEEVRGKEKRK